MTSIVNGALCCFGERVRASPPLHFAFWGALGNDGAATPPLAAPPHARQHTHAGEREFWQSLRGD